MHLDGQPVMVKSSERWTQQLNGTWKDTMGHVSADGKYIDDPAGEYLKRDWMDITMEILVLAGRIISPVRWLHNLKVYDLGRQGKGFSGAAMSVWGAVLMIVMVQAARDLVDETDPAIIHKRAWDGIQAAIDLAALPFDFGLGAKHPALAITGALLNIASAGGMLAKDALTYA